MEKEGKGEEKKKGGQVMHFRAVLTYPWALIMKKKLFSEQYDQIVIFLTYKENEPFFQVKVKY